MVTDVQGAQISQMSSIETKQSEERKSEGTERSRHTLVNESISPKRWEQSDEKNSPTLSICGKSWQEPLSGFKNKKSLFK